MKIISAGSHGPGRWMLALALSLATLLCLRAAPASAQQVEIHVDAQARLGPWQPIWRFFGYDEPNYTYTKYGRQLLSELSDLSAQPVYVRTHNLLTSGDGTPAL